LSESFTNQSQQEDLHVLNAHGALLSQKATTIDPCQYKFPSSTFDEAIAFAATFTDLVLGTLQDVIEIFSLNGDNPQTRAVASIVGQEGEQEGFYRILQNKNLIPNALPFLTTSTRDFAFSALEQGVIVSCPNDNILKQKLKLFGTLNVVTSDIEAKDQNLKFNFDIRTLADSNIISSGSGSSYGSSSGSNYGSSSSSAYSTSYSTSTTSSYGYKPTGTSGYSGYTGHSKRDATSYSAYGQTYGSNYDWSQVSLVYINQQNLPIVEKLQNVEINGFIVSFEAFFPFEENLLNSLTIAAVTKNAGPFANASEVADNTLFAPGLIEVN
jgi:hypothetical protein